MASSSGESGLAASWPGIAAVLGTMLLLVGLLLPAFANPAGSLSEDQAQEYYEAHAALEKAASQARRPGREKKIPESPDEARQLEVARRRFEEAKTQVDTAKTGSANLSFWLKMIGGVFVVAGACGLLMRQSG